MGFTGVLAVIFLFLAGGYRTIQKRWPDRWGPILPVWAHSNLSLAAARFRQQSRSLAFRRRLGHPDNQDDVGHEAER